MFRTMKRVRHLLLATVLLLVASSPSALSSGRGVVLDGSTTLGPLAKSFAAYFTGRYGVRVTVSESGSGNGVKSLINGSCDVATMSRPMKALEVAAARKKGINPVEHVVALDVIAVVVHPANPVRTLSKPQLQGIYTGRITNWRQVGGPNTRIVVIQRESNSGTQEAFRELVLKGVRVWNAAETQASNGAIKNRIASTRSAIGFMGVGFVDRSLKIVAVDGIVPSVANVKNHRYPVVRPLYMYTRGQPAGTLRRFMALPFTSDGKQMVAELGFVNR